MFSSLALLFALTTATPAEAGVVVSFGLGGIHLNAWSPHYVPAARSGWRWSAGHYDVYGQWQPGHWRPYAAQAGNDWVPGYWVGTRYYDGYWRPLARLGYLWTAGRYDRGHWNEGYWSGHQAARGVESHRYSHAVREERRESREDRHEAREDRNEAREDRHERGEDRREKGEDRADRQDDRRADKARVKSGASSRSEPVRAGKASR